MTESEEIHRFIVGLIVRKGQRLSPHGGLGVTLRPEWLKILTTIMHYSSSYRNMYSISLCHIIIIFLHNALY